MENILAFLQDFVAGWTAERLVLSGLGLLISFFPSVRILEWIKMQTGWKDRVMHKAVVAFFALLAVLFAFLTGEFDPTGFEWTLDNLIIYYGIFATVGEAAYQRLKARQAS